MEEAKVEALEPLRAAESVAVTAAAWVPMMAAALGPAMVVGLATGRAEASGPGHVKVVEETRGGKIA